MSKFWAQAISWGLNPGCLVLAMLGIGVITSSFTRGTLIGWLILLGVLTILGIFIGVIAWARGMVLDADLLAAPMILIDRSRILLVYLSLILMLLIVTFRMGQPEPLHALLVTLLILGFLVVLITIFWKISLHMLGSAMVVTALLAILGTGWWWISLLIPLIAWARLKLKRHTPLQLMAGLLLGFSVTAVVLYGYGLI